MKSGPLKHLRVVIPITMFSLVFIIVGSAIQKMAIGVSLAPRGFIAPSLTGAILGILLGIWMARDHAKHRIIQERSRQIEVLNAEILRRETELQRLLNDKELLLAEVHHRVRNILQLLSSIVALETSLCEEPRSDPERTARGLRRRIESIAIVYDQLVDPTRSLDIQLTDVVAALAARYGIGELSDSPMIKLEVDRCTLPIGQSIPLSLVIDELFDGLNHSHYAEPPSLHISVDAAYCRLRYRGGLEESGSSRDCPCHGTIRVGLFRALAAQLNGSIDFGEEDSDFRAWDLSFPLIGGITIDPL